MRLAELAAAAAALAAASVLATSALAAPAQTAAATTAAQPDRSQQAQFKGFFPDPSHIPFILPENIPWSGGGERSQQYNILGNPNAPGPYIQLLRWNPGAFSRPHFHEKVRYITVISGTWWVSSSNVYDPSKTYPIPAGSLVRDEAGTVHWDGAKDVPVVLLISGEGPAPNIAVDENGNRLPPRPPRAPGAAPRP